MADTKIMIIDDNEDILFSISQICEYKSWKPYTASDFYSAMELLGKIEPDLILVDYHMPEVDGIKTVREIRKKHKTVPIIVLTVEMSEKVVERFMGAGADDYAIKPIKAMDLISRINVHLKNYEQKKFFSEQPKGIRQETLDKIMEYLRQCDERVDINAIADATAINFKTVNRYVNHLEKRKLLVKEYEYGKVGRPRAYYRIRMEAQKE